MKIIKNLVPIKFRFILTVFCFCFIYSSQVNAQTHTFPTFSPGAINSSPTGAVTTVMPVAGVTGNYLLFTVEADFVGDPGPQTSWSSTIEIEISDGSGLIYVTDFTPTTGGADNGNNTTITFTGTLGFEYVGGTNLSIEFWDGGEDGGGPYLGTINNVIFTIDGFGGDIITIMGGGATTVTGTHPDFTVTSTDTQLSEAQVDAFVANNGFLTSGATQWNTTGSDINYIGGNVGIGTASPSFDLQVNGNVDVTGELTAASDKQLKKNIIAIDNANAKIASLNPVSYDYRVDEFPSMNLAERNKMGLIAQEVQAIFPSLVSAAGTATKSNGTEIDILSVNYMEIIPLLIKAVQEHEVELKNKDAQIELLMAKLEKINGLENEMAQLKASISKKINTEISSNLKE